jgi:hypothetical protein
MTLCALGQCSCHLWSGPAKKHSLNVITGDLIPKGGTSPCQKKKSLSHFFRKVTVWSQGKVTDLLDGRELKRHHKCCSGTWHIS